MNLNEVAALNAPNISEKKATRLIKEGHVRKEAMSRQAANLTIGFKNHIL